MKVLPAECGALRVGTPDQWHILSKELAQVKFSGFIYIYSSNSTSREVNFDNLKAVHYGGDLQSEFHYYPFGLSINLSQAFGATEAPLLFTSQHFERGEFSDGKGLNLYDFLGEDV